MRRNYISDAYEALSTPHDPSEREMIALRADSKALATLAAVTIALLTLLALGLLLWPQRARAEEPFVLPKPACYPAPAFLGLGDTIDARLKMADGPDIALWWCSTTSGMERNYRAGEWGAICERCFRDAVQSFKAIWEADRGRFTRDLNERERMLLLDTERLYEPRCVFTTTAKTTGILDLAHVARMDEAGVAIRVATTQTPSCWTWQVEGTKRYCSVDGLTDTKGRAVPELSYVPCKVTTAPDEGWAK